jgi:hypothetical protein
MLISVAADRLPLAKVAIAKRPQCIEHKPLSPRSFGTDAGGLHVSAVISTDLIRTIDCVGVIFLRQVIDLTNYVT